MEARQFGDVDLAAICGRMVFEVAAFAVHFTAFRGHLAAAAEKLGLTLHERAGKNFLGLGAQTHEQEGCRHYPAQQEAAR